MKFLIPSLLVLLSMAHAARAQDYLGSSLQAEDFGRQLERSQGDTGAKDRAPAIPATQPASNARMQALMQSIKPEYDRRVRENGKASADRWLRTVAWDLGQKEGRATRASQR